MRSWKRYGISQLEPSLKWFSSCHRQQIWENLNMSCQISLIWVARTLSRNVEMHRICLHAITLERNCPPSNAKLVLNAKWKCDVWLCGCRKSGTKRTDQKSLRNGKSSMQWVGMQPGYSENIHKWLARGCAGNKAECSGSVALYSLSVWHRYFIHSQGLILLCLSRSNERELSWSSVGILPEIRTIGPGYCFINRHLLEVNSLGTQCRYHLSFKKINSAPVYQATNTSVG